MRQARLLFRATINFRFLAERKVACEALFTVTTKDRQTRDHMITRLHVVHVGTYGFDYASTFVT